MGETSYTDEEYELWWLLMETMRAVSKMRNRELAPYGVTHNKIALLLIANSIGDEATPARISRGMVIEPHTTSAVLDVMERKGLITKSNDLDRRNLVRIKLTEKGRRVLHQGSKMESIHRVINVLSEEERRQMRASLEKIWRAALGELGIKYRSRAPFPPSAAQRYSEFKDDGGTDLSQL